MSTAVAARTPLKAGGGPHAKLPFGPLEDLVAGGRPRHPARGSCTWCYGHHRVCITVGMIAERLGVNTEQVHRWRRGGLPVTQADALAVAVGLVPDLVWGPAWDVAPGP